MRICKHFGECGGCRFQDIDYPRQCADKQEKVRLLLQDSGLSTELKTISYGEPWYYRNKMEFSFARNDEIICGFYGKPPQPQIVDLEECLIFSPDAAKILKAVKTFVNTAGYSVHNKYTHKGFLRHLIIREAKFTKELMVGLVSSSGATLDKEKFIAALKALSLESAVKSIYWISNDSYSDAVVFEKKELLYGSPTITEKLGDFVFAISIDTFFQVNPRLIVEFYSKIHNYLNLSGQERVLDLFCGTGPIGIFLAAHASFVWGVEVSQEIVELARQNAKANSIKNISFFAADARNFLNTQGLYYKDIDVLIVNPPRSGLSNKILRAILRLGPKRMVYSSCNPTALFRDLGILLDNYRLEFAEPFDFFPHTPHLECLCLLHKK